MRTLIDTNVAIELANGNRTITERVARLADVPLLSVVSRVELEGGVHLDAVAEREHRERVDALLEEVDELPFTGRDAEVYGRIVRERGFSRRLVIDRMIAAQAIAAGAVLATMNMRDFRDVAGLGLEDWSA